MSTGSTNLHCVCNDRPHLHNVTPLTCCYVDRAVSLIVSGLTSLQWGQATLTQCHSGLYLHIVVYTLILSDFFRVFEQIFWQKALLTLSYTSFQSPLNLMTPLAILGTFFAYYVIRSPLAHCSASNSYLELIQTNTNVWVTTTFTHSMLHLWHSVRWNEGRWSHIVALFAVILTHCINDHLKSKADLIFKTTSIYFNRLTHFETIVAHDNSCTAWPMKTQFFRQDRSFLESFQFNNLE